MKMRFHYAFAYQVLRFPLRLLWGFRVEGAEKLPREGGVLVASNHISYADPVVVGSGVPRELHYFAKVELFRNRWFGRMIRSYNAVPVRRGGVERETIARVVAILRGGGALLFFPEGTRSKDGRVGEARPGIGMIALSAGVPIVPVYVRGTRGMGRTLFRRGRLALFYGEPVDPEKVEGENRKDRYLRIGDRVIAEIRRLEANYG
ncbi:MAG: 1-acyl-sn-glycerol-3-phosphate acyltransferase [Candidatus Eisenbacteria bacterium]|nr:1-acyl-sn-glycerol-3-phosphate acyltransferase [Candidatus Eisenbacteria bacterium]